MSSQTVWQGRYLNIDRVQFERQDHQRFEREIVRHVGSVAIVPFTGSEVVLVRQFRPAVERWLYEIPAGKIDAGEEPEACAIRECAEEVGLRPGQIELVHEFFNSPGFLDERSFLFIGTDLQAVGRDPQGPEEQEAEIVKMPLNEVEETLRAGEIVDAKTLIGLYAVRRRLV